MKVSSCLKESLSDISTENKLYHRTNLLALIGILKSKKLKGFKYIDNTETKIKHKEIATARKATMTTIDRTNGIAHKDIKSFISNKKNADDLSTHVGSIEIELFKDRVRTLRGVNIEPVDEYRERDGEERIILKKIDAVPTDKKYMSISIKVKDLDRDFNNNIHYDFGDKEEHNLLVELRNLIRENLSIFVKDHNFNYFVEWLDDKLNKSKK